MATTLGDIATAVVDDHLKRDDLREQAIRAAKKVYLLICGKVPFDELCVTSPEVNFAVGVSSYSLQTCIGVDSVAGIVSIRVTAGSIRRRLKRSHARAYDALGSIVNGIPSSYARWGHNIEVNPAPVSPSYTWRVRYWSRPTIDTDVALTELLTPPEWDELLEWETLYRMYTILEEHEKAMMLVAPKSYPRQASPYKERTAELGIIPRLWNDLLKTVSQRENIDEDFTVNPIQRAVTYTR